jgi:hypothetical protein
MLGNTACKIFNPLPGSVSTRCPASNIMKCFRCVLPHNLFLDWTMVLLQGQAKMKWSLSSQACYSFIEDTKDISDNYVSLMLAKMMAECSCCFWNCYRNSGCNLVKWFSPDFELTTVYNWHPPSGADEVHGQSWQLVTAISDEGDGLTLCEQLSQGYDCTHCHDTL